MRIGEFTSQDGTAGFQAEQCLFNIRRRKSEKISELRCRSWTEMRHPAADRCEKCIVARGGARFDFRQLWFKAGAWKQRSKASYSLGCDPIDATIKPGASGTILPEQSLKVGTPVCKICVETAAPILQTDRKSTRLNSSHITISYAVFCLKKKKKHRYKNTNRHKNKSTSNL